MNMPAEWHEERMKGLGGSDIAAALGVSPWKTQLELWGEKTGLAPSDFEGNEFTYWGEAIESILRDRFQQDHAGWTIWQNNSVNHADYDFLKANVDGIIRQDGENIGVWEAKTASQEFTEVPVHYQLQVQHYMEIYNLPFAVVSVLFHGNKYQEFRIERDPAYESDILPVLIKFWQSVEAKLPSFPAQDFKDVRMLMKVKGQNPKAVMNAEKGSTEEVLIEAIQAYQKNLKNLKKLETEAKSRLTQHMADMNVKSIKINGKASATIVSTADSLTFDMVKFKSAYPNRHAEYMTKKRRGYTSLRVAS